MSYVDQWENWQKLYQYGTIVIWPPDDIRSSVNRQRQEYDPVSQSYCEAHITVTQPLLKLLSDKEWYQIRRLLQRFDSFEIQYGPLNSFLPYPCIWYEIEPGEKVLQIREALHQTGYFNLDLSHTQGFVPHLTITEGQSGPNVDEKFLERLRGESSNGSFLCSELAYIIPDRAFCFGVHSHLALRVTS